MGMVYAVYGTWRRHSAGSHQLNGDLHLYDANQVWASGRDMGYGWSEIGREQLSLLPWHSLLMTF